MVFVSSNLPHLPTQLIANVESGIRVFYSPADFPVAHPPLGKVHGAGKEMTFPMVGP